LTTHKKNSLNFGYKQNAQDLKCRCVAETRQAVSRENK